MVQSGPYHCLRTLCPNPLQWKRVHLKRSSSHLSFLEVLCAIAPILEINFPLHSSRWIPVYSGAEYFPAPACTLLISNCSRPPRPLGEKKPGKNRWNFFEFQILLSVLFFECFFGKKACGAKPFLGFLGFYLGPLYKSIAQ